MGLTLLAQNATEDDLPCNWISICASLFFLNSSYGFITSETSAAYYENTAMYCCLQLQLRKSKLLSTGSIVDVSYCDMKSDLQEVNWSSLDVSSTAGDRCTTPLLPIGPSSLMFDSSVVFSDSDQEDVKMSNTVQDIIAMLASDAGGSSLGPPMFSSPIVVTDADQEDVKMINMVPDIFGMLASDAGGSKDEASSEDVVAQTTISSDDIDEYLHGLASDAVPTSTSSLRISQPSSLPIHDNSLELGLQPLTVSLVDNARHYTSSCWDLADIENFLKDADPLHVPCSSVVREALDYKPSTLPVFSGPTDAVQPPPLSSECCQYERGNWSRFVILSYYLLYCIFFTYVSEIFLESFPVMSVSKANILERLWQYFLLPDAFPIA